jgi:hypothetical protein
MAITTREQKGGPLTHAELDRNFTDLRDGVDLMVPKEQNSGLRVDSLGDPSFSWHDILGLLYVDYDNPNRASFNIYRGSIRARQFAEASEAHVEFHLPHDYVVGTPIYIHVHWSHTSLNVTGGTVTWGIECTYAKGHDQAAFCVPVIITVADYASTTQYQHMIAETAASTPGGSAVQLDTGKLEPDGIIQCRVFLDSNDIVVSGGSVPAPFVHFVDIHYQSTCVGTKNREPNFWG